VFAHIAEGTGASIGAVTAVIYLLIKHGFWLTGIAISGDDKRWRRFRNLGLFVVGLALLTGVAAGWWLLGDGGIQAVIVDIGRISAALHGSGARLPPRPS
jgi:hypothetical protein